MFSGLLTPISYTNANRERNRFLHYQDGQKFLQRRSQTKSSPTILEYLFNKLKRAINNSKKRRSLIQKRRLKLERSRFVRPHKIYHTERNFNPNFVNSVSVQCRRKYPRRVKCSKRFPYEHLRCCSVLRTNNWRYKWAGNLYESIFITLEYRNVL